VNNPQRKIAAVACWLAAAAIPVAYAARSGSENWLAWLGAFTVGYWHGPGGLVAILLAALGAIAWTARGTQPPPK